LSLFRGLSLSFLAMATQVTRVEDDHVIEALAA
jgi:hypothetical protein